MSALAVGAAADPELISEGKKVFRFDTFGDEQLWTDKLGLHKVVETKVDPTTALTVGLKVDSEVLPPGILEKVDLKDPATTVALLKMNAVVGLKAEVDANNHITQAWASPVRCVIPPSMIPCRRASASGSMAGPTATSTSARSSRCRRRSPPTRRRSTRRGVRANTIRATTRTGRTIRWSFLRRTAWRTSRTRRTRRKDRFPTGTHTSP